MIDSRYLGVGYRAHDRLSHIDGVGREGFVGEWHRVKGAVGRGCGKGKVNRSYMSSLHMYTPKKGGIRMRSNYYILNFFPSHPPTIKLSERKALVFFTSNMHCPYVFKDILHFAYVHALCLYAYVYGYGDENTTGSR